MNSGNSRSGNQNKYVFVLLDNESSDLLNIAKKSFVGDCREVDLSKELWSDGSIFKLDDVPDTHYIFIGQSHENSIGNYHGKELAEKIRGK